MKFEEAENIEKKDEGVVNPLENTNVVEKNIEQVLVENVDQEAGISTGGVFLKGTLRRGENGFFLEVKNKYQGEGTREKVAPTEEEAIFNIDPSTIRRKRYTKSRYLDLEQI